MDDILITLRPLGGNRYAYQVWIDDEVPAHRGEATGLEAAKSRVQDWLGEAISSTDAEG